MKNNCNWYLKNSVLAVRKLPSKLDVNKNLLTRNYNGKGE